MAKEVKKKESKPRAEKYEEKVHFEGTLEDMIKIAVKPVKIKPAKSNN